MRSHTPTIKIVTLPIIKITLIKTWSNIKFGIKIYFSAKFAFCCKLLLNIDEYFGQITVNLILPDFQIYRRQNLIYFTCDNLELNLLGLRQMQKKNKASYWEYYLRRDVLGKNTSFKMGRDCPSKQRKWCRMLMEKSLPITEMHCWISGIRFSS